MVDRTTRLLGGTYALIAFLFTASIACAQDIDPHQLYEQRCSKCHAAHAGDFVHDSLILSGGKIIGRKTSKELRAFLSNGHGKLDAREIEAMVKHLESIRKSGRVFHNMCLICHDRAAVLARTRLILKDGRLVGRYSGRDMTEFLQNHGRLDSSETAELIEVLKRQLQQP